jgi:hypothetical protein
MELNVTLSDIEIKDVMTEKSETIYWVFIKDSHGNKVKLNFWSIENFNGFVDTMIDSRKGWLHEPIQANSQ